MVIDATETLCLTTREENLKLGSFERKIIRKILGPKIVNKGEYKQLLNYEINEIM